MNTGCGHFGDPLQEAAFGGGLETVELLLENGAAINTEHGEYGNALIAAAHRGRWEVAKKLIRCGADPDLSSRKNGKAIAIDLVVRRVSRRFARHDRLQSINLDVNLGISW